MSLRNVLEDSQIQWAGRNGIRVGAPPGRPNSKATGYVSALHRNLFEPLSDRVRQQFIDGAGGELRAPNGQSGNMYAVYSSSALCVNCFHYWSRLLHQATISQSAAPVDPLPILTACGLPPRPATRIDFEVPNVVSPDFKIAPHLDVQIAFESGPWNCAGIEAKFCEPYGAQRLGGLKPAYVQQENLWEGLPNVLAFAQTLSPDDVTHSHLHAAQLLKHLLGLKMQNGSRFVLVYLWFDVPGSDTAIRHRREIENFGTILQRDGVAFISRTYQDLFAVLRGGDGRPLSPYVTYLLERYLHSMSAPI